MCGIVGFLSPSGVTETLLQGLRRLEYRGYDSAGLAVLYDAQLHVARQVGKVAPLQNHVHEEWPKERINDAHNGIAHTRWATHGPPTTANAHPHLDQTGDVALVHNGIIENYRALRNKLSSRGHEFHSDTDSEVLAHLIGEGVAQGRSLTESVALALRQVEGTWGLVAMSRHEPDTLVAARCGSPIVIGVGEGETLVASDASAILSHTRQVIYLDDRDIATIGAERVEIQDQDLVSVDRAIEVLDYGLEATQKGEFAHFMEKEIHEQPEALENAIRGRLDFERGTSKLAGMASSPRERAEIARVVMLGCGTSLNAGMVGEYAFEALADLPARVAQAAEFRYRNPILSPQDLVVAISQSGETADTLAALREAKEKGANVMGLCNVVGSTIAREAGRGVYLHAGPEISVASTKAFTCQVAVLLLLALNVARVRRFDRVAGVRLARDIESLPELARRVIERSDAIREVAQHYAEGEHAFFLGRGPLYPVALEGALKLKEISYIHAEGYHAAELKHGPIALLEEGTPVIALANKIPGQDKTLGNVEECRARGARVLGIVTEGDETAGDVLDEVIEVPDCHPLVSTIPTVIALQLFAYHVAVARGCEIDQPRNLAKSVTVE